MSNDLVFENVGIIYPNFRGEKSQFNEEGKRNFNICFEDPDLAQDLLNKGVHVRELSQGDEEILYLVKIRVNFNSKFPPRIYTVHGEQEEIRFVSEEIVDMLDFRRIEFADLTVNLYEYKPEHYSLYLKTLYLTLEESPLDAKYAHLEVRG